MAKGLLGFPLIYWAVILVSIIVIVAAVVYWFFLTNASLQTLQ